jgi:hypothetical protein
LKGDLLVRALVVFQRHLEVDLENGEVVADSSEGYHHPRATGTRATPITMAEKLNPNAELVVDDTSPR